MSKLIIRFEWILFWQVVAECKKLRMKKEGEREEREKKESEREKVLTKPRVPVFRVFLQVPRICDLNSVERSRERSRKKYDKEREKKRKKEKNKGKERKRGRW